MENNQMKSDGFLCHVMSRPAPPLPGPLIARAAAGEPNGCVTCFRQGADLAVRENHLFTMVLNKKRHVTHCVSFSNTCKTLRFPARTDRRPRPAEGHLKLPGEVMRL